MSHALIVKVHLDDNSDPIFLHLGARSGCDSDYNELSGSEYDEPHYGDEPVAHLVLAGPPSPNPTALLAFLQHVQPIQGGGNVIPEGIYLLFTSIHLVADTTQLKLPRAYLLLMCSMNINGVFLEEGKSTMGMNQLFLKFWRLET